MFFDVLLRTRGWSRLCFMFFGLGLYFHSAMINPGAPLWITGDVTDHGLSGVTCE